MLTYNSLIGIFALDLANAKDSVSGHAETGVHGHVLGRAVGSVEHEADIVHERAQRLGLLSYGIATQTFAKIHHAERKVVLRQPVSYLVVLHVRSGRHVNDEIAKLLPVAHDVDGARSHFRIRAAERDVRRKAAVDAKYDGLGLGRQHGQVKLGARVIAFDHHFHLVDALDEATLARNLVLDATVTVGELARVEEPLAVVRRVHDENVHFLAREHKVKWTVGELGAEHLFLILLNDNVIGTMIRR